MKINLHLSSKILILLIVNICVAAAVLFLYFKFQEIKTVGGANTSSYSFSFLPKEVVEQINLGSRAFIIYEPATRSIVAGRNEKFRFAPASSAKIMAAIIVLKHYNLNQVLTASGLAELGPDNSKMGLYDGEQMTVENLLCGMMLPSGNDAAFVLARNFPGGIPAFVFEMNKLASKLGLSNTHFIDPDGYDDANFTTAYDLARLGAYGMKIPQFEKIVGTRKKVVTDATGNINHVLENLNILLGKNGVNGIKTGFTQEAGGVLVTSVNSQERNYIVVVLGSRDRFLDTESVLDKGVLRIHEFSY